MMAVEDLYGCLGTRDHLRSRHAAAPVSRCWRISLPGEEPETAKADPSRWVLLGSTCVPEGIVVRHHDLTGIVVGVTVSLSLRIPTGSVLESNARMRTEDTIVAFETCGRCGVRGGVDTGMAADDRPRSWPHATNMWP